MVAFYASRRHASTAALLPTSPLTASAARAQTAVADHAVAAAASRESSPPGDATSSENGTTVLSPALFSMCLNCSSRDAVVLCKHCGPMSPLCAACDHVIHANVILRRHERLPLRELRNAVSSNDQTASSMEQTTSSPMQEVLHREDEKASIITALARINPPCFRHASEAVTMYCATCGITVCPMCASDGHRSHSVISADVVAREVEASAPAVLDVLGQCSDHVRRGIEAVESALEEQNIQRLNCRGEVDRCFDAIAEAVERRRRQLLDDVERIAGEKTNHLRQQRQSLMRIRANVEHSCLVAGLLHGQYLPACTIADVGAGAQQYAAFVAGQKVDTQPMVDRRLSLTCKALDGRGDGAPPPDATVAPVGSSSSAVRVTEGAIADVCSHLASFGHIASRSAGERVFAYEGPNDHSGVLYYYGTQRGICMYSNPCGSGIVRVAASSIGYGCLENVVAAERQDFCTQNFPSSWVQITLPDRFVLRRYVIQHDAYDTTSHFLRDWVLEASGDDLLLTSPVAPPPLRGDGSRSGGGEHLSTVADVSSSAMSSRGPHPPAVGQYGFDTANGVGGTAGQRQFHVLVAHRCEPALTERTPFASFEVRGCRPEGYKVFRFVQRGPNSHGNHYLMLSSVEFYGVLLP